MCSYGNSELGVVRKSVRKEGIISSALINNQNISHATCLCKICENAVFFMQDVNQSLPKELNLPSNPYDIVEKFSCNSVSPDCMNSKCKEFESGAFETDNISSMNGNKWIAGRKRHPYRLALRMFLPASIHMSKHQSVAFTWNVFNIRALNLKERKEILIQVDYCENYFNNVQAQIYSAYFGQESFLIFTACCCYLNTDRIIINENVTITSEANDHSRSAAMSCWRRVLSCIREKYQLADSLILHIWSDGCSGQFRSRCVFFLFSRCELTHTNFWYYNERHHGAFRNICWFNTEWHYISLHASRGSSGTARKYQ